MRHQPAFREPYGLSEIAWAATERAARRDALRHIIADIPDPADFARWMPLEAVEMLLSAHLRDTWYVSREFAVYLRPMGLVGYGTTGLTAFGIAVRRALKEPDA